MVRYGTNPVSSETLHSIAKNRHANYSVLFNIACHPNTLPKTLAYLAKRRTPEEDDDGYSYLYFHERLAVNPRTPPKALMRLATYREDRIDIGLAGNPQTPEKILCAFAGDPKSAAEVVRRVALNPSTPFPVLTAMVDRACQATQNQKKLPASFAAAANRSLPHDYCEQLATNQHAVVRRCLAQNPSLPEKLTVALASDPDTEVRVRIVENDRTPPEILARLAGDRQKGVRAKVARNDRTPPETLSALARDVEEDVRSVVARNDRTPLETLSALSKDTVWEVRASAAANTNTPVSVLARLAEYDGNGNVVQNASRNPSTPSGSVKIGVARLKKGEESHKKKRIAEWVKEAQNPNTRAYRLDQLASGRERVVEVYAAVAANPNIAPKTYARLLNETDGRITSALKENTQGKEAYNEYRLAQLQEWVLQAKKAQAMQQARGAGAASSSSGSSSYSPSRSTYSAPSTYRPPVSYNDNFRSQMNQNNNSFNASQNQLRIQQQSMQFYNRR